jgi:hypothetical protein
MNGQNGFEAGTSLNISCPATQAGGWGIFRAWAIASVISWRVVPWANPVVAGPKLSSARKTPASIINRPNKTRRLRNPPSLTGLRARLRRVKKLRRSSPVVNMWFGFFIS